MSTDNPICDRAFMEDQVGGQHTERDAFQDSTLVLMQSNESEGENTENPLEICEFGESERRTWSLPAMAVLCSGSAASAISWAAQVGYSTPTFRILGVSDAGVALIWIIGPISGIIVQPLVGMFSDRCRSSWGRRRPFLAAGTICTVVSLIMLSSAERVGHRFAISFGILSFTVLDCSLNMMMASMRALIAEILKLEQHTSGNAFISIMAGVGKSIGYAMGSADLRSAFPIFGTQMRALYSIVALLVGVFASLTIIIAREVPVRSVSLLRERVQSLPDVIQQSWRVALDLPRPIARVFIVQFFNMFGLFALMIYTTEWFTQTVFHASTSDSIEEAIRYGNLALFSMSFSSMFWAALLPKAIEYCGLKPVYCFSQAWMSLSLMSLTFVVDKHVAVAIFVGIGLPFASANLLPWIVVTTACGRTGSAGLYSAIFNLAQCFPEIIFSFVSSALLKFIDKEISVIFAFTTFTAVLSAIATLYIEIPELETTSDVKINKIDSLISSSNRLKDSAELEMLTSDYSTQD